MVIGAAGLGPRAKLAAIVGAVGAAVVVAGGMMLTMTGGQGQSPAGTSSSGTPTSSSSVSTEGRSVSSGAGPTAQDTPAGADDLTTDQARAAARVRVFFGHQSVGWNLIDALPGVYAEYGAPAPTVVEGKQAAGSAGSFLHAQMGRNTDPRSKIDEFAAVIRGGVGDRVDVALLKFCYVDFSADTDAEALFATYRATMDALQRDYPDVVFLHVTAPLMTEDNSAAENMVRQRYNEALRSAYPADVVFDLAAVESTAPDGARVSGRHHGATYYALYDGYSDDGGHLDAEGAARADAALIATIARAVE
jgi:hypothetical protein